MNLDLELLFSIPKSFYASWKLTSFKKAFHFPVVCRYNVKLLNTSGLLIGNGRLRIGFNKTGIFDAGNQPAYLNVRGTIIINGLLSLGAGSRLDVGNRGTLVINGSSINTAGGIVCCHDRIEIGDNTLIGWDTLIMDSDFHYMLDKKTGKTHPMHKQIIIGSNVWICSGSKILKGSVLPNGCVLSAGSVLNKSIEETDCLLQGNPARIVKSNVSRSDVMIV